MTYETFDFDVNQVMLVGTVTNDPEIKNTKNGTALLKFRLLTTKPYTARTGEIQSTKATHNVTIWGQRGEEFGRTIQQGSRVFVIGEIKYNKFKNHQGHDTWITDITASVFKCVDMHQNQPHGNLQPPPPQQPKQAWGQRPAPEEQPAPAPSQAAPAPTHTPQGETLRPEDDLPF